MSLSSAVQSSEQDEIAAALAAIQLFLSDEERPMPPQRGAWRAAALLEAQQLPPARNGAHARWFATARALREARWSEGLE